MAVARTLFRGWSRIVIACPPGFVMAAAMSPMPPMTAMAEHMHRDHPNGKQYPNPVLCNPIHD